jgi:selenide,water dikinase
MIQLNDAGRDVMIAFGAHAATDVTGFGLAGHTLEMALGSNVTIRLELSKLPIFPGAEALAHKPYVTRASKTNASYVESELLIEGKHDPTRLAFFYDAQTSGGMLISLPADRAEAAVRAAQERGMSAACIIGEVVPRKDRAIILS